MKKLILLVLCSCVSAFSSTALELGTWTYYMNNNSASNITYDGESIYVSGERGVLYFHLTKHTTNEYNKINALSDIPVQHVEYNSDTRQLFVLYNNGNIDVIKDGREVFTIPDLRNKIVSGSKEFHDVFFDDEYAYLSSGIGVIQFDLEKLEIRQTIVLGATGNEIPVYDFIIQGDNYYALTERGLLATSLNDGSPLNFENWDLIREVDDPKSSNIAMFRDTLWLAKEDSLLHYSQNEWTSFRQDSNFLVTNVVTSGDSLYSVWQHKVDTSSGFIPSAHIILKDANQEKRFELVRSRYVEDVVSTHNGIWITDRVNGMVLLESDNVRVRKNSPVSNRSFKVEVYKGFTYHATGGIAGNSGPIGILDGYGIQFKNFWNNFNTYTDNLLNGLTDFVAIAVDAIRGEPYFASYFNGVVRHKVDNTKVFYDETNSTLKPPVGGTITRVIDMHADVFGNIWMSNIFSTSPVAVKLFNDEWLSFSIEPDITAVKKIMGDSKGNVWFANTDESKFLGLVVMEPNLDNGTVTRYRKIQQGEGNGNLPTNSVSEIVEDLDGNIWIGTSEGIGIFSCGSFIYDDCDAIRPIVEKDGFNVFLFETEVIKAIAVDGANRKWVGTQNGVWLLSEDGLEELVHFNEDNSPLASNIINDIAVNPETGEVYFSTEAGLVSYRGDATVTEEVEQKVLPEPNVIVYPNPVLHEYRGNIAIKGLANNVEFKIVDIAGNLVFQGISNGGQGIWSGRDYTGNRAASGVYTVLSTNDDGDFKARARITFIH